MCIFHKWETYEVDLFGNKDQVCLRCGKRRVKEKWYVHKGGVNQPPSHPKPKFKPKPQIKKGD